MSSLWYFNGSTSHRDKSSRILCMKATIGMGGSVNIPGREVAMAQRFASNSAVQLRLERFWLFCGYGFSKKQNYDQSHYRIEQIPEQLDAEIYEESGQVSTVGAAQALGTNASVCIDNKRDAITGVFEGDVHGDILQANQDNILPTTDGLDNVRRVVVLDSGVHLIRVHVTPDTSHAPVQLRLNWYTADKRREDHQAAIDAAREARVAVVFLWARREPAYELPGDQSRLVEEVAAVNPHTIVVLNTSQPVALPWANRVNAILQIWWPGDEGSWATANLLLGRSNPSGRLPVSWGYRLEDYPASDHHFPERSAQGINHRTIYSEGVHVGYRWFDHENIEHPRPLMRKSRTLLA